MKMSCSILLLFVLMGFAVFLVVPAEDVAETAYDESEALPYVSTCVFSIEAPKTVAPARAARTLVPLPRADSLRTFGTQGLDYRKPSPYPVSDSLTILDRSLRF